MANEPGLVNDIRHYPNYNHQTYYNQFHYPRQIIVCEGQAVHCCVITSCFVWVLEISLICIDGNPALSLESAWLKIFRSVTCESKST